MSWGAPAGQGDGEDAPFVDALGQLFEAGVVDQLVHLGLAAPAHHPGQAAPVAGEGAGDEFELGVPGLAGIDEVAAGLDGLGEASQGADDHAVVGEELIQAGDDADGRLGPYRCYRGRVEGVALLEVGDVAQPLAGDEGAAVAHVDVAEVAQQDGIGLLARKMMPLTFFTL